MKTMINAAKSSVGWFQWGELLDWDWYSVTYMLTEMEQQQGWWQHNATHHTRRWEYPWVMQQLRPWGKQDMILDAGGGKSSMTLALARVAKQCTLVDIDQPSLDYMREHTEPEHELRLVYGDMAALPWDAPQFDKTVCISSLEHIGMKYVPIALKEMLRVTKPGGLVLLTTDIMWQSSDKQMSIPEWQWLVGQLGLTMPPIRSDTPIHAMIDVPPYVVAWAKLERAASLEERKE